MSPSLLGYRFSSPDLAQAALRHPSAPGAVRGQVPAFERLEFLGDRVLGLIIADWLFDLYPHEAEGPLSRRLAALVRASTLAEIGRRAGLPEQVQLASNEGASGGSANDNIVADALEAVLGAIYLDGGLEPARATVRHLWAELIRAEPTAERDAKTRLQEWAQSRGTTLPRYDVVQQSGPSHAPMFEVKVVLPDGRTAQGQGSSKRQAEQAAARNFLDRLELKHD